MPTVTANLAITDGTLGCHDDNLRCHQWGQSWHHDSSYFWTIYLLSFPFIFCQGHPCDHPTHWPAGSAGRLSSTQAVNCLLWHRLCPIKSTNYRPRARRDSAITQRDFPNPSLGLFTTQYNARSVILRYLIRTPVYCASLFVLFVVIFFLSFFLPSFIYLFVYLFIYLFIHSRQDSFFLSFNSHFYSFIPYYLICVFLHLLCLSIHLTLVSCPLSVFLYLHYYCLFCLFVNGIFLILFSVVLFSIKHRYYSCTKEGWAIWISHTTRINTQI